MNKKGKEEKVFYSWVELSRAGVEGNGVRRSKVEVGEVKSMCN